jgi:anti-sigma28 factor (negative regulator of flagellin synthesis)
VPGQPASDGLVLSAAADRFRQWRGRLESLPETARADRLAQLKALVASGGYSVGGEQIAQGMLDDPATAAALGLTPPQR